MPMILYKPFSGVYRCSEQGPQRGVNARGEVPKRTNGGASLRRTALVHVAQELKAPAQGSERSLSRFTENPRY